MLVVACSHCGTKNRVDPHSAADQIAKCGKCGTPLDVNTFAKTSEETKPLIVTDATFQRDVLESNGRPVLLDCRGPLVRSLPYGWPNHGTARCGVNRSLSRGQVKCR